MLVTQALDERDLLGKEDFLIRLEKASFVDTIAE